MTTLMALEQKDSVEIEGRWRLEEKESEKSEVEKLELHADFL